MNRFGGQSREFVVEVGFVEMCVLNSLLDQILADLMEPVEILCTANYDGWVVWQLVQVKRGRSLDGGVAGLDGLLRW